MELLIVAILAGLGCVGAYFAGARRAKAAQEQLAHANDQIALLQSERHELEDASARATQALHVRTEFLANVSHEIRTPLNGVLGMTSVLLETELSREQYDIAQTIAKSGETLMAILNEILDFSKLEANAIRIESFPFDLRECVEDVLDLFAGLAHDKRLDLACRFDGPIPGRILGDVIRIRQVLSNLVSNAVKFTERGEVVVDVEVNDNLVTLTVSDSGVGMDDEACASLFVPFRQFGEHKQPGTGLGLVICKRLTELMHGEIMVSSSPGLGTEITVQLPLQIADAKPSDLMWETPGIRVGIVGPELTSRDVLGDHIKRWGMEPWVVTTCKDLDLDLIEVVLIFAESIDAAAGELPIKLPKVLVSWLTDVTSHEQADALGTRTILDRPVRYRELRTVLKNVFESGTTTTSSRRSLSRFEELASKFPRHILVAEDNPTNRRVATAMLKRLGYDPVVVENGKLALDAILRQHFDIVFMDIHMPVMGGIEATKSLREALPASRQPWVVALTAGVNSELRKAAQDAGVNDYIVKPFMVESLRATIEQSGVPEEPRDLSEPSTPQSPYDQLKLLYASTPKDFAELVDGHIRNVNLLIHDMDRAIETHQLEALGLAAHSLKASCRMFGHDLLGENAETIETLAAGGDLEAASRHFSMFRSRWGDARSQLENDRDSFDAG